MLLFVRFVCFFVVNCLVKDEPLFSCNIQYYYNSRHCLYSSDSADKVVQGGGKFEEIVVASNEITASTVQLVSEAKRVLTQLI